MDPPDAFAWNNTGNALWGLTRYEAAVVAYDRALALDSNCAAAWNIKAISLRVLGSKAEAREAERWAKKLGG